MKKRDWLVTGLFLVAVLVVIFHRPVYEVVAWTYGGNGNGGAESTGYLIFSSIFPCLTMLGSVGYAVQRVRSHLECHHDGCSKIGYVVHGTPYRACHGHHPASEHEPGEPITAEHIRAAHEKFLSRS